MSTCPICHKEFKTATVPYLHKQSCGEALPEERTKEREPNFPKDKLIKMLDHLWAVVKDGDQRSVIQSYKIKINENSL